MKYIINLFLVALFSYHLSANALEDASTKRVNPPEFGIVVPMQEESQLLLKNISSRKQIVIDGIKYETGKIAGKDIVFINTGIGKINSSVVTTRLIRDFHPKFILLSGSAGNINPARKEGEVVVGKNVVDVDFGKLTAKGIEFKYSQYLRNPQTNSMLPLEFNFDSRMATIIHHINNNGLPKIILGKIATSDELPNQPSQVKLLQEAKFDVIDMEGSSVMQACWLFKIPCVVIRGVSNNVEDTITPQDIEVAADNAAKVSIQIIADS